MKNELINRGFKQEGMEIFNLYGMIGWVSHYIFPNRAYGVFVDEKKWSIVRRDVKEFLDSDDVECLVSWVVKDISIDDKADIFLELYKIIEDDLGIV